MERGPGVVTRRTDLHRRDLQDRREADLRQGRITLGPFRPFQLEPRWQRQARNRHPRGRSDRRGRVQGVDPRGRKPKRVVGPRTKKETERRIRTSNPVFPWRSAPAPAGLANEYPNFRAAIGPLQGSAGQRSRPKTNA